MLGLKTTQKLEHDLLLAEKTTNSEYTQARLNEINNANVRDINRVDAYIDSQNLKNVYDKTKNSIEGLGQGAVGVVSSFIELKRVFTDFGNVWEETKRGLSSIFGKNDPRIGGNK